MAEENDTQPPDIEAVDPASAGSVLWRMVIETRFVTHDGELGKTTHVEVVEALNEQAVRTAFVDRIRYSWQQILKVERLNDKDQLGTSDLLAVLRDAQSADLTSCGWCNGTGMVADALWKCAMCEGTGKIVRRSHTAQVKARRQ